MYIQDPEKRKIIDKMNREYRIEENQSIKKLAQVCLLTILMIILFAILKW